ncbi:MAG: anthranilate synthase component I [Actinobacteria bacterium]|nr:anthranilate synthase component I [Actinomycetota bacterium]
MFSGTETPLSIFEKLAMLVPGSFLLESAEQGVWSRYSFIGVSNLGFLISTDSGLSWKNSSDKHPSPLGETELSGLSGFDALELLQRKWKAAPVEDLPPLVSGMVGLMGWDSIHQIENLPEAKKKEFPIPDLAMAVIRDMVVVDHLDSSLKLVSNMYIQEISDIAAEYEAALARIQSMKKGLLGTVETFLAQVDLNADPKFSRRTSDQEFEQSVLEAQKHVVAGDVFQVVISQRFDMATSASPLDVYRMLRAINPSPYMYLLNFFDEHGDFAVVGSSPEALVRINAGEAVLHPIAGSRPRGKTGDADLALATELSSDAKEKAEHLMLVDLARNDLLKVCEPSSVAVTEFMTVERYSHIMHLVSTVSGKVLTGSSAVDVVRATFPAGTLSGAPKPRALEIIENLEPANRGLFGGVVGYFDFAGNADLAIAIRTAVIRDGLAHVQAGAGIVLDSDPKSENQETLSKASAPLRAIQAANSMTRYKN